MATKVAKNSKKVAAKRVVKAAATLTSEQFKLSAKLSEAWMAAVVGAEVETPVKGTNAVQALGQGALKFRKDGKLETTGKDQLKGAFAAFDNPKAGRYATAAVTGSDTPLDSCFTRQGLVRIRMLSENQLCANPADQKMVDAIYGAIRARYPEFNDVKPVATRTRKAGEKVVENPNPIFA